MARYTGPKNRIARRFGANIFGKAKNPLVRKPNPPGQHGARRKKKSDYGMQLEEKQKLKAVYGMLTEKQLVNAYHKSSHAKGNTAKLFMQRLECRLDNLVYRLGFAPSIFAAQQLVAHGHVQVDGKRVDRRSFFVQPGMTISIQDKSRKMKTIIDTLDTSGRAVPDYLTLDRENFAGKLAMTPEIEQIEGYLPLPINIPVVCEFLAHRT